MKQDKTRQSATQFLKAFAKWAKLPAAMLAATTITGSSVLPAHGVTPASTGAAPPTSVDLNMGVHDVRGVKLDARQVRALIGVNNYLREQDYLDVAGSCIDAAGGPVLETSTTKMLTNAVARMRAMPGGADVLASLASRKNGAISPMLCLSNIPEDSFFVLDAKSAVLRPEPTDILAANLYRSAIRLDRTLESYATRSQYPMSVHLTDEKMITASSTVRMLHAVMNGGFANRVSLLGYFNTHVFNEHERFVADQFMKAGEKEPAAFSNGRAAAAAFNAFFGNERLMRKIEQQAYADSQFVNPATGVPYSVIDHKVQYPQLDTLAQRYQWVGKLTPDLNFLGFKGQAPLTSGRYLRMSGDYFVRHQLLREGALGIIDPLPKAKPIPMPYLFMMDRG